MIRIDLKANTAPFATSAAESDVYFNVTGKDVHNRSSRHQVVAFSGERRCCDYRGGEHLHLSARCTVVSSYPQARVQVEDIRIGDCLAVGNVVYTVRARKTGDPVLVPAI